MFSFFSRGKGNSAETKASSLSSNLSHPPPIPSTPTLLELHLNQQFEQAENLLKAAVTADSLGNNHDAFDLYQQSLNIWLEILNQTTEETRRTQIADLIALYMSKAEDVKMRILAPPPPVAMRQRPAPYTKPSQLKTPNPRGASGQQGTLAAPPPPRQDSKVDEHEEAIMSEMLDSSPGVR
jgi:hypothetical protein